MEKQGLCTSKEEAGAGREVDIRLADRIRRKEEDAMAELYDLYGSLAFSVLFRMVGNRGVAEDLTQEVFMRVWTSVDTFDGRRGGLRTWILAIARNKVFDYWRSVNGQMDRRRSELDECATQVVAGALEAEVIRNDSLRALREALPALTERQQQVLRLTYFEGKTQVEIADKIQAPLGSVKTWVRTGVIELRRLLNNQPKAICT